MFSGTLRLAYEVLLLASPMFEVSPRPAIALIFFSVFSAAETQTFAWTREEMKFCARCQTLGICSQFADPAAY